MFSKDASAKRGVLYKRSPPDHFVLVVVIVLVYLVDIGNEHETSRR
jgi:hypothetical protein